MHLIGDATIMYSLKRGSFCLATTSSPTFFSLYIFLSRVHEYLKKDNLHLYYSTETQHITYAKAINDHSPCDQL